MSKGPAIMLVLSEKKIILTLNLSSSFNKNIENGLE
jgi:hypothetical protein